MGMAAVAMAKWGAKITIFIVVSIEINYGND